MKKETKNYLISDIVVFLLMGIAIFIFDHFFNFGSIGISLVALGTVFICEFLFKKTFKSFYSPQEKQTKEESIMECMVILLLGGLLTNFHTNIWIDMSIFYLAYMILSYLSRSGKIEQWSFKVRSR